MNGRRRGFYLAVAAAALLLSGVGGVSAAPGGALKVIVIDPGHGGRDSGAIGPGGLKEKDVTLEVALETARRLRSATRATVLLTRTTDEYVTLEDRTAFANSRGADIFISIHANAARRAGARGVETFFLSFEASDEDAREVAAFENDVIRLDTEYNDAVESDLMAILWDLTQTETHHASSMLAESVHRALTAYTGGENRGVKQAPFIVLFNATMPAVLVEMGFITNPSEEKRLSESGFQKKIAEAIVKGVLDFEGVYRKRMGSARLER
ncbi:MAG TPA: N-acetylmuramoyl-L-alanine amidase [Deltaproteobacteria bacterium]|nr:N-acetylmuramoyl-L-alanine amidase [Deltaproteobacteria bacterium]